MHAGMIRDYQSSNKRRLDEIRWLRKDCKKVSMRLEARRNSDPSLVDERPAQRSPVDMAQEGEGEDVATLSCCC